VIVSVLVFTIGVLGICGLTTSLIRMNRLLENTRTSTMIAEARLEALQATPYISLKKGKERDGNYLVKWTVLAGPVTGSKELVVTVTWENPMGRTQETTLRTLVAE
jgi:Tfp pilus assembly protein PilV